MNKHFSNRDIKAIEIWRKYQNSNIEEDAKDIRNILDALIILQQYIVDSKIKIPAWKVNIDTLTSKFILHTNTLTNIALGTNLQSSLLKEDLRIIDIPSIIVLLRTQLECFLMFDFIYHQPDSDLEKEFRFWVWKYDNLIMRNKIPVRTEKLKSQKIEDQSEILELKDKIENSPLFSKYTKQQRKEILKKGNSKLFKSWTDLIDLANLNDHIFSGFYSILSSYTHSGMHSLMNLRHHQLGYHKNHSSCHLFVFYSKLILCVYIQRFKNSFKSAEIKYNTLPGDTKNEIEFFCQLVDKRQYTTGT